MKKILLLLMLCCFGAGICLEANARKRPVIHSCFFEKKRAIKNPRSIVQPIVATFTPDGNAVTLNSPENCDRAFITISGSKGEYLTDLVNFTDKTATLDVSKLDCGVYLITVEYENGAIYTGQFEFIE